MANGSFYNYPKTSPSVFGLYCEYTFAQNIANNYTDVKVDVYLKYYAIEIGSTKGAISVNGTSQSYTASAITDYSSGQKTKLITSTTIRVYHNSDGTKANVPISVSWNGNLTYSGVYYSTITASTTINLPTIPRSSTITSVGNVTLGNACSVTFTPASTSHYYSIKFSLGSWSAETGLFCPGTTTAYTYSGYTIPANDTLYTLIPNSTTGTMTAALTTYSSNSASAKIGSTSSKNFTVTVPSSVVPTIGTITLTPQTYNNLIQNKNKVQVSVSGCSAGAGSTIKSYTFSGPNLSATIPSTSATSGIISTSGTKTYKVTVTDNRGRTTSQTATITCYPWSAPSVTIDAYRVTSSTDTTENDNGTYVKCTYNLTYSSVNSTNDATVKIYYKKSSASSWLSQTVLTDSKNTSGSYVLSGIDAGSTYIVYATITDNYGGNSPSAQTTIFGASRIINITKDGTGVAFGKMAENTKLLESRYKIKTPGITSRRGNRPVDANTSYKTEGEEDYLGTMEHYLSSNQMTTNKPPSGNGHIIHCHWDVADTAGDSQLFLHASTGEIQSRGCSSGTWNDWRTSLDSVNYTSYVSSKPTILYSTSAGNIGTITLSESAANFTYLEIFYTDNNDLEPNSVKIYSPNGKYVSMSCIEPSTSGADPRVYIRTSGWTISGTSMTVGRTDLSGANRGVYGQIYPHANGTNIDVKVTENNYIKIFRILGYK